MIPRVYSIALKVLAFPFNVYSFSSYLMIVGDVVRIIDFIDFISVLATLDYYHIITIHVLGHL